MNGMTKLSTFNWQEIVLKVKNDMKREESAKIRAQVNKYRDILEKETGKRMPFIVDMKESLPPNVGGYYHKGGKNYRGDQGFRKALSSSIFDKMPKMRKSMIISGSPHVVVGKGSLGGSTPLHEIGHAVLDKKRRFLKSKPFHTLRGIGSSYPGPLSVSGIPMLASPSLAPYAGIPGLAMTLPGIIEEMRADRYAFKGLGKNLPSLRAISRNVSRYKPTILGSAALTGVGMFRRYMHNAKKLGLEGGREMPKVAMFGGIKKYLEEDRIARDVYKKSMGKGFAFEHSDKNKNIEKDLDKTTKIIRRKNFSLLGGVAGLVSGDIALISSGGERMWRKPVWGGLGALSGLLAASLRNKYREDPNERNIRPEHIRLLNLRGWKVTPKVAA